MELARMTSKGQLTIPVSIRRKLGVDTGDQLLFYEKNGQIIIASANPAALADAQAAAAENYVYSVEEIRAIASPIAREYQAEALILIGSYARGEANAASDLDFVIRRGEVRTLIQLGGMKEALEQAFHKKVDILPEDSLEPAFRESIEGDGVTLYERRYS